MLRLAACLEEHFPHSMANAVVQAAQGQGPLPRGDATPKVEYIVAHGIASSGGRGEGASSAAPTSSLRTSSASSPKGSRPSSTLCPTSTLICTWPSAACCLPSSASPIPCARRPRACIRALRALGIRKTVMLTGDSDRTAAAIAAEVGVDDYRSEVLPEDKASYVAAEHAAGRTVIMLGDGINDSPALSAADVGIAISDGAAIAREIADITVAADSLCATGHPAEDLHGADEAHPVQLPLRHRLQRHSHRPGRLRDLASRHLRSCCTMSPPSASACGA